MDIKIRLLSTVSATALLVSVGALQAQDITGTPANSGTVTVTGAAAITGQGAIGVGASSSISAAGASASVAGLASGANFTSTGEDDGTTVNAQVGNITLNATNEATGTVQVQNGARIAFTNNGGPFSDGASASISGLGAAASVSFSGIGAGTYTVPPLATDVGESIQLTGTNRGQVTVDGTQISAASGNSGNGPYINDDGASISIGATGAASGVSLNAVQASGFTANDIGPITQTVTNESTGVTTASDNTISLNRVGNTLRTVAGNVSVGSTGAAASVSATSNSSTGFQATFDTIGQTATNNAAVATTGSSITTANVTAVASNVSVSTAGSVTSVSEANLRNSGANTASTFGAITQGSTNTGTVTLGGNTANVGQANPNSGLLGDATSLSMTASGASASVSSVGLNSAGLDMATFDPIGQTVTNAGTGAVLAADNTATVNGGVSGDAASASIAAVGASGSVGSLTSQIDTFSPSTMVAGTGGADFGTITQTITNNGTVTNTGSTLSLVPPVANPGTNPNDISGAGASAGISAAGAVASVSGTMVDNVQIVAGSNFNGLVTSSATNTGNVLLSGATLATGAVSGSAASANVSALGAQASAASTNIDTRRAMADFTGGVTQTVNNTGGVTIDQSDGASTVTTGAVSGGAASVQMGATGASGVVSATLIGSGTNPGEGADFGAITQTVTSGTGNPNTGATGAVSITGQGGVTPDVSVGEISGIAASAGISAAGGSASVSAAFIDSRVLQVGTTLGVASGVTFGDIISNTLNTATVSVTGTRVATSADISGTAASASISATGATASAGASVIGAQERVGTASEGTATFSDITQTARNLRGADVSVDNSQIAVTGITGTAASAGIGATGASASVQASYIGSAADANVNGTVTFGKVVQGSDTAAGRVANGASVSVSNSSVSAGTIVGPAASASITATGAQANVGVSGIGNTGTVTGTTVETVTQALNNAPAGTVDISGSSITTTGIAGQAASASIAARGASASVSVSEIGSTAAMGLTDVGVTTQDVINRGTVTVGTSTITNTNGISGPAASAAIAASGASANYSVTGIANTTSTTPVQVASIVQNVVNESAANVTNSGSIVNSGGILGTGASASIVASGASTGVSVTSVNNSLAMAPVQVASITQTATNNAAVSNSGTITVGGALGTAASASISAVGASTGVSFTSISASMP